MFLPAYRPTCIRISRLKNTVPRPEDLLATLSVWDGDSDVFFSVGQLVPIGVTSPIGSCEVEGAFLPSGTSEVTCVHPWDRIDRLAGLMIMAVHSSHAQQVDTQAIVQNYIQANPRRLF